MNRFVKTSAPRGLALWMDGLEFPPAHYEILQRLARPDPQQAEILKQSNRRSVLRIKAFSPDVPSLIVKGFPLQKIESQFKYKKYGLAEFSNYREAAARKIPAPKCFGYFEVRRFGLVTANGVLIEDLQNFSSLDQLARAEPPRRTEIFLAAIPLLKLLFETGVNHIDPSPHNMMQSHDATDLRLIDWQYCAFVPPRQPAQLVLQAAHFLNYAELAANSPEGSGWLNALHAAFACPIPRERFHQAVAHLRGRGKISGEERLQLTLEDVTRKLLEV